MCKRYELGAGVREIVRHFRGLPSSFPLPLSLPLSRTQMPAGKAVQPRERAPLIGRQGDAWTVLQARWGLVGAFLDREPALPVTTLAAEGLARRPFYSRLLGPQRCLVPLTAVFDETAGGGQRFRASGMRGELLLAAGVFDHHPQAGTTFALLTRTRRPGQPAWPGRWPVLLRADEGANWLDCSATPTEADAEALLVQAEPLELRVDELPPPEISPQLAFHFA